MRKNFVLDTNVLLHDPEAIHDFAQHTVIIPIYVIEELDTFKKGMSELARNAREFSRILDQYRASGSLGAGVSLKNGGILKVAFAAETLTTKFLDPKKPDNFILAVAMEVKRREPDSDCILITKDVNLRVRADALGLAAENYEERDISLRELYPGACEVRVPEDLITVLHEDGELRIAESDMKQYAAVGTSRARPGQNTGASQNNAARSDRSSEMALVQSRFYVNEYVLLRAEPPSQQSTLAKIEQVDSESGEKLLKPLPKLRDHIWGIRPRNKEQYFALDALLDDRIDLVTLIGKAGTGKTLLAIAAGLHRVTEDHMHHKLVVSRPVFPMGRDIGYLPGSIEDKLQPWMRPIFDNVEYLMGISRADKRAGRGANELMDMGIIEIEPLTYIRGRSLPNQYIIVDEAQNLTPHEVKTILTRVGEGTKIVLTGDPYQIDNPYVDSESNGLTYVLSRFKGQRMASTVTLFKGERSELAELAANLL